MKIAYILAPSEILEGLSNGVRSQVFTWANSLRELGEEVTIVNASEAYNWKDFDVIHLFGSSNTWFFSFAKLMKLKNPNIVWSPICDDITPPHLQLLKTYVGYKKLHVFSLPYVRKNAYPLFKKIFVRSNHEKEYIIKAYKANAQKIAIVPLSMSYDEEYTPQEKENFCFHMSLMYQKRKNVLRLIQAAKKYNFKLVLAGKTGNEEEFAPLKKEIGNSPNIQVLGFISEEEKINLYKRAKVFALPSIMEGVGIVAVDAANYGCEIVITEIGGPKEYYGGKAFVVNPYSVDDIGRAVVEALSGNKSFQPELSKQVHKEFNKKHIAQLLLKEYQSL
jgi:glycosyltransferase involved in cell wall biosynthesis